MATHKGSEGTIRVGANVVAEIRSFTFEQTADTIEDTALGDSVRSYVSGLKQASGSIECFWDETDTSGQGALDAGASVTLNLYPEGAESGDTYFSMTALVTGVTINSSFDGMVEASITFQATGAITETTV